MRGGQSEAELRVTFDLKRKQGGKPGITMRAVMFWEDDLIKPQAVLILDDPSPLQILAALAGLQEFARHNDPYPSLEISFNGLVPEMFSQEAEKAYNKAHKTARQLSRKIESVSARRRRFERERKKMEKWIRSPEFDGDLGP
jgi:hypothetical protein